MPDQDPASCPTCGNDLYTLAYGCPGCGLGRKGLFARTPTLVPLLVWLVLSAAGLAALFTVGAVAQGGLLLNATLLALGPGLVGYGVHAIRNPTSLTIVDVHTDAFGQSYGHNPRGATGEQGTMIGAICVVLGMLLTALGVWTGLVA